MADKRALLSHNRAFLSHKRAFLSHKRAFLTLLGTGRVYECDERF